MHYQAGSPVLFADMAKENRSAHLGHGLAEYKKDHLIAFYSNCSGTRNLRHPGHNGFGWVEYKRSADGGKSWSDPAVLSCTWEAFLNEPYTMGCEKAVSPAADIIVAFLLRTANPEGWEPYLQPAFVRSEDGGKSWSSPQDLCSTHGRIYDAMVHEGVIYVLFHACADWLSTTEEHQYRIYKSTDQGKSFRLHSTLPDDPRNHAYGSMVIREDGALLCYEYDKGDEYSLLYHLSRDMGKSWQESGRCLCAKRIRNPQVVRVKGGYLLHGRSGCESDELPFYLVIYSSPDGIHWDEGQYLSTLDGKWAYYSNSIALQEGERLLLQSSVPYDAARVNVCHWWLEIS